MWTLTEQPNRPNSVKLESSPMGFVLELPFMLGNADATAWQTAARREILEAIADEGEKQLGKNSTIIEAQQAASAVEERMAAAETVRQKIAEFEQAARDAALKGDELNLDAAAKRIATETAKLAALESIPETLQATAEGAAQQATQTVRNSDAAAPIYKQLQKERAALIAGITDAVQDKVQRLAIVEHQMTVAMTDAASIKSGLNRKYVPTVTGTSPAMVR